MPTVLRTSLDPPGSLRPRPGLGVGPSWGHSHEEVTLRVTGCSRLGHAPPLWKLGVREGLESVMCCGADRTPMSPGRYHCHRMKDNRNSPSPWVLASGRQHRPHWCPGWGPGVASTGLRSPDPETPAPVKIEFTVPYEPPGQRSYTEKETEAQRSRGSPEVTQQGAGAGAEPMRVPACFSPLPWPFALELIYQKF